MKRFLLFIIILASLWIVPSCDNEETTNQDQFPEWLEKKIVELVPDQKYCEITDVTIIKYNGEMYYHVYCGFWSCVYCQLFDDQGNRLQKH